MSGEERASDLGAVTVGEDQVVDELVMSFTHDRELDIMLQAEALIDQSRPKNELFGSGD